MPRLLVRLLPRPTPVLVEPGLLPRAGEALAAEWPARPVLLVTDPVAGSLFGETLLPSLAKAGFRVRPATLWGGEAGKTLATVEEICAQCAAAGIGRDGGIVALGGGVVTDLAGFAAAVYRRGIEWVAIPTTLLAMADAAIGGKTAANLPAGKNLVGAFHQPRAVLADPDCLRPLPPREFLSGLAEIAKAAVVGDRGLFERLEERADAVRARDARWLADAVAAAVAVKAAIVERDERESGERMHLNLGHTMGHAIEAAAGFGPIRHGEAVAIGLAAACRIGVARGLCDEALAVRVIGLLERLGLPTSAPAGLDLAAVAAALAQDKKSRAGKLRWVLPRAIGRVEVVADSGESERPERWIGAGGPPGGP
ncbi:MAG: 3-dehydroquinate synthase [Planctomycetales bacterium]|nr:3-dehydroquinate synthase [Planctomycetales bacterium]